MIRIHVIGNYNGCYDRHLFPIRVFKNTLLDNGLEFHYYPSLSARNIDQCDFLIFLEGSYRNILPIPIKDKDHAIEFLQGFLPRFKQVIWFDDHDSSGMLRVYVFPMIDSYAKSQLMKNTDYYKENHLTGILHRDYVYENFGFSEKPVFKGKISDSDINKLSIGWNLALVNWAYRNQSSILLKQLFYKNISSYSFHFTEPNLSERLLHVSYRAGLWENLPTVNWWRKQTLDHIMGIFNSRPNYKMNSFQRVNISSYNSEMQHSMVCPSPFGMGEICYRDFESFMNGALLFKPNMDHLITWPNLYIDNVTYVSHKWDFSDFDVKLEHILDNPKQYEEIAREGQRRFKQALTDGQAFAAHLKTMLENTAVR